MLDKHSAHCLGEFTQADHWDLPPVITGTPECLIV